MRAATITDWDMRELIVPNKEFITTRVINWTLSTTVSRMSINIGVSGNADSDRIRALLLEMAQAHPLVLKDPPPHALLDDFREGVMQYVLRVYMPTRDVYLELRHGLLTQIAARFQREGIEFAFPQREIHVRQEGSIPPEPPRDGHELVLPASVRKPDGRPIGSG
jgi:potassium efflux system protein